MKRIAILGSTGSVGRMTLEVIEAHSDKFKVMGLSANSNAELLNEQSERFHPDVCTLEQEEIEALAGSPSADIVVIAISGAAALGPLLKAIRAGKRIALANKEALVMAGEILMKEAEISGAEIIPLDSEHSAIFQCLNLIKWGQRPFLRGCCQHPGVVDKKRPLPPFNKIKRLYITGSGGPLNNISKEDFSKITLSQVLNHPKWDMGRKITVDSATLMNKGLEVIEARWLFGVDYDSIEVLIHPEAVVHSMVEFADGTVMAQMAAADMRLPIQYALTYPERIASNFSSLDFSEINSLTFGKPDTEKFPSLHLAERAGRDGGTVPCVLNAANEESVKLFLDNRIEFLKIYELVEKVLSRHTRIDEPGLEEILEADKWARDEVRNFAMSRSR